MRLAACAFLMRWWGLDGCITTDNLTITLTSSRHSSFFPPPRRPINILPPPCCFSFDQSIIPFHHPSSSIHHHSSYFFFSKNPLKEKKWYHVRTYACVTKKAPSLLLSIPLFRFFFCRVCLAYRFLWDVYSLSSCRFRTFCLFAFEPFVPKRLFSFFLRPATSII